MAKIFIFRHGETTDNKDKIFSGWRDVDLTPFGIEEAQQICEKLQAQVATKAYCSDLIRSKHTLDIVLNGYHTHVEEIADPRIKERNYGDLTGTSKVALEKSDPEHFKLWHRSYAVAPPGGESIADVEKRVLPFLHDMLEDMNPNDIIFISAHGNSMRPMRKYFEHLSNEAMTTYEYTPATIYQYEV